MQMMTPEEFASQMQVLAERARRYDEESAHIDADELMCKVLTELGYGDGVAVFEQMSKWYS